MASKLLGLPKQNAAAPLPGANEETFVIGAGFGRTGTSSMQIALRHLGWRSYHMREVGANGKRAMDSLITVGKMKCALREQMEHYDPSFGNFDETVLSPDAFDWNQLFKDGDGERYNATVDFPVCAFYLDLIEFYKPNYKVILTVRDDAEQWYESVNRTIRQVEILFTSFAMRMLGWLRGTRFNTMRNVTYGHLIFDQTLGKPLEDPFLDKQQCMKKYDDWIEGVKKHVPEDKLLIFNVKEGWKPLCEFLGVDAPDEPFPRSNETKDMLKFIDVIRSRIKIINGIVIGVSAAMAVGAAYVLKKQKYLKIK